MLQSKFNLSPLCSQRIRKATLKYDYIYYRKSFYILFWCCENANFHFISEIRFESFCQILTFTPKLAQSSCSNYLDDQIQTAGLCWWKLPLCQICHWQCLQKVAQKSAREFSLGKWKNNLFSKIAQKCGQFGFIMLPQALKSCPNQFNYPIWSHWPQIWKVSWWCLCPKRTT